MSPQSRAFVSIEGVAAQAEALINHGRHEEAEPYYRQLIAQTHVIDYAYDDWLRRLAEIYKKIERPREAGFVYLYLHYFDRARESFSRGGLKGDQARVFEVEKRYSDAAKLYGESGYLAHEAVCFDKAKMYGEAGECWKKLLRGGNLMKARYESALVSFNYGMALKKQEKMGGIRALIESQQQLEQVAEEFEIRKERERAFDCYQIILQMGKESGQFENLAEGYLNCIRVLKEDNLKFYVLQYYEDFIAIAEKRNEFHAVATLYQEASDYALRSGLPYDLDYRGKAALAWVQCAEDYVQRGVPVELAENALLAGIDCYCAVGDYLKVASTFELLSNYPINEKKKARYHKIATKYFQVEQRSAEMPAFPDYLKQQHAYSDIWFADVLEWELGGDAGEVAASIVGDLRYPNGIRRRALVIILSIAAARRKGDEASPSNLEKIAELLGELQSYAALKPLEKMYEHESPVVRRAAIRALRFLFFKRSFVLIRRALTEDDPQVLDAAVDALKGLHFPHAFNPLACIFREHEDLQIRIGALESIGKIQNIEAGEFLISVLRQEEGALAEVASRSLGALDNADVAPILRQYFDIEKNKEVRSMLSKLLLRWDT